MGKYVVAIIILIFIGLGGYYYFYMDGAPAEEAVPEQPQQVATSTYATTTFSVVYPQDFTLNDAYAYEQFPGKPIAGVSFTIPNSMATGTNLSADTYVSVESLPRAKNCTGDIYVVDNVRATEMVDGGVSYSVASSTGAGAGNLYEEWVYALVGSKPCTAVRYFIHSTNIGNYPEGTVRAYDRAALIESFDSIRRSLQLR